MKHSLASLFVAALFLVAGAGTAHAVAGISNGNLNVIGDADDDRIGIVIGPAEGVVTLYGVPEVPDGTVFEGAQAVRVFTLEGADTVHFRILNSQVLELAADTDVGNDLVVVQASHPTGVAWSDFNLLTGAGHDRFYWLVKSEADSLVVDLNADTADGNDLIYVQVISPEPSDLLVVNLEGDAGSGRDTTYADVTTNTENAGLGFALDAGSGSDYVQLNVNELAGSRTGVELDVDLGSGWNRSAIYLNGKQMAMSGTLLGGSSIDRVKVGAAGNMSGGLLLSGQGATDVISMDVAGDYEGALLLEGNDGYDWLSLQVGGAINGSATVDGGAGRDVCIGDGTQVDCEFSLP